MSPSPQAHLFFRVRLSKQKLVYPVKDYPEDGEPVYVIVFSYPGPGGGAGQFSVDRLGSASPLVEEVSMLCLAFPIYIRLSVISCFLFSDHIMSMSSTGASCGLQMGTACH